MTAFGDGIFNKASCGLGGRREKAVGWGRGCLILGSACAWGAPSGLASCLHCRRFLSSCHGPSVSEPQGHPQGRYLA